MEAIDLFSFIKKLDSKLVDNTLEKTQSFLEKEMSIVINFFDKEAAIMDSKIESINLEVEKTNRLAEKNENRATIEKLKEEKKKVNKLIEQRKEDRRKYEEKKRILKKRLVLIIICLGDCYKLSKFKFV